MRQHSQSCRIFANAIPHRSEIGCKIIGIFATWTLLLIGKDWVRTYVTPFLGCRIWFSCSLCIQDSRLMSGYKYMCELENLQRWLTSTNNTEMPSRFWLQLNFRYTKLPGSVTVRIGIVVTESSLTSPFRGAKMTDALTLPRVFPPSCAHIHGRPNLPHFKEIEGDIQRHRKIR